jgi:transposase
LFHAEGWRKTEIAHQFGLHHSTVGRVLAKEAGLPRVAFRKKAKIDPYLPFVSQTLEKFPKLNATRLHHMVKERGYTGGVDHFRDIVRSLRPQPKGEAYLRLATLPGEQAQVDWGHFGKLQIGAAERRLLAFVMVLSWSRQIFLRFYLGDDTGNFLRGHVEAFSLWQSVPREILYDNMKTAVIERVDSAIRFNPELLRLAAHYRFAAKPVPVARPTSKGRVERAIQYVRSSFFAAREFQDLADLNRQAQQWCQAEAIDRRWPQDKSFSVAEAFEKEKLAMLSLPDAPYPAYDRKSVQVGKTPYVRFDGNDYSIPHEFVRQTLLVEATLERVRIINGIKVLADHERSFDKGRLVEESKHIDGLVAEKRNASSARGLNRILNVVPSSKAFFKIAAERGHNMGRLTQLLIALLDLYGSSELEAALSETLASGTIHSEAVRKRLEVRRSAKGLPPAVTLTFLKDRGIDEIVIKPKSLDAYDRLLRMEDEQ